MNDIEEEADSVVDQSMIMQSAGKKSYNLFQMKRKSPNTSDRVLIQQPNQFPHINVSIQHNESLGFHTNRSSSTHNSQIYPFTLSTLIARQQEQDSIMGNSPLCTDALNSGRVVRMGSDLPLRTASRESILSGTPSISMLLSPMDSHRSKQPQEQQLKYQLESWTQKLADKERRSQEMDNEI